MHASTSNVLEYRGRIGMLLLGWFVLCKSAGFVGRKELSSVDPAEYLNQFCHYAPYGFCIGARICSLVPARSRTKQLER